MGLAYLPDGGRMDYEEYLKTDEWRHKKNLRYIIDHGRCGICRRRVDRKAFETHHLSYARLGHEDVEHDLLTICHDCHANYHAQWKKSDYWNPSKVNPIEHWKAYSLQDTAKLCLMYQNEDYWLGGQDNLCNENYAMGLIDRYYAEQEITVPVIISEHDVMMVFRNWRYEIILANAAAGKDPDAWLDETFGTKGGKGGNKHRAAARAFYTKHPVSAIKRIMKENECINILMDEIKKMEGQNNE